MTHLIALNYQEVLYLMAALAIAAFLSAELLWVFRRTFISELFLDAPNHRKMHQRLVPRMGNLGIVLGFIVTSIILYFYPPLTGVTPALLQTFWIALGGLALIMVFDDSSIIQRYIDKKNEEHAQRVEMPVKFKFLIQFSIATAAIYLLDLAPETLSLGSSEIALHGLGWPLALIWIVGVMNAYNIIDGIDALLGSLSVFSFSTIGLVALLSGNYEAACIAFIIAGTTIGFLLHNYSPAFVFMGDTGSLFLGFAAAVLPLYILANNTGALLDSSILFYLAGLPVLETIFSMGRRFLSRQGSYKKRLKRVVSADNQHMHHRFLFHGFTHNQTAFMMVLFGIHFNLAAVTLVFLKGSSFLSPIIISALHCSMALSAGIVLYMLYSRKGFHSLTTPIYYFRGIMNKTMCIGVDSNSNLIPDAFAKEPRHSFDIERVDALNNRSFMPYDAVIIERKKAIHWEDLENLLENLYQRLPNTPVILVCPNPKDIQDNELILKYKNGPGMAFLKQPFYTPMLMSHTLKLIRNNRNTPVALLPGLPYKVPKKASHTPAKGSPAHALS